MVGQATARERLATNRTGIASKAWPEEEFLHHQLQSLSRGLAAGVGLSATPHVKSAGKLLPSASIKILSLEIRLFRISNPTGRLVEGQLLHTRIPSHGLSGQLWLQTASDATACRFAAAADNQVVMPAKSARCSCETPAACDLQCLLRVFAFSRFLLINRLITEEVFTNHPDTGTILSAVRQFWGRAAFRALCG